MSIVNNDSMTVTCARVQGYQLHPFPILIFSDAIIGFEQNEYPVSEGDGSATVCINLNNTIERNVTVTVSTQAVTAQGKLPFLTSIPIKLILYFLSLLFRYR